MHYYKFNIGDYASHTRHLSLMEDLAYRRLLDLAYSSEKPLTKDVHAMSRLIGMRDYQSEIKDVLEEFFDEVEDGWIHGRVLQEIEYADGRVSKAKMAAKARWDKMKDAKAMLKQCSSDATSIKNDAPSTKNDATHYPLPITQDTDKNIVASKAANSCPHEEIISLYHEALPEMPRVQVWTEKRRKLLTARWKEDVKRQNTDYWKRLFTYVSKSDFLCGRTEKPFSCTLEWMLNATNFVKIIEGTYHHE